MTAKDITIRHDFDVDLVDSMGSDEFICKAARVSTLGAAGLIRFLMNNRHGTMTFRISAPIFVWREFMRHRIGISYNEESGRYKQLDPVFYIPPKHRKLVQTGKPGHYNFVPGNETQYECMRYWLAQSYLHAWISYEAQLANGIAREVARMCLPVAIYSTAYVTLNPRSLMHFLSLRTKVEESMFPSSPMWEINQVANTMESVFAHLFPITHNAFNVARRVAP